VSVHWLQPLAWWGLGLVALPILIHLLARHRSRRVLFPSLKFLPVEPMAALRRRVVTDWPLLVVRVLIVAAAVAALASPVVVSSARRAAWDRRVARAMVVTSPATDENRAIASEEARASYASAEFGAAAVPDAVREARLWLAKQAPAAREIVVVGDLREGMLSEHDLTSIPSSVGLRFLPVVAADDSRRSQWRAVADSPEETPTTYGVSVTPDVSRTLVRHERESGTAVERIRVEAGPADQPYADAVLRAVLREGVMLGSTTDRMVTIAFEGASLARRNDLNAPTAAWMLATLEQTPSVRGGESDGALIVLPTVSVRDARAPRLVAEVLRTAFAESRAALEPRRVSAATLAAWSRPPGPSPPDAVPADEGDRRWFWGGALLLLALEHVMRRRRVA
jgi:hypothetical protein